MTTYLDRLLELYEVKLKQFRFLLALLLMGTTLFFFLIFFPYMTFLGNREDCLINQQQCSQFEQSQLEQRFSDITTSWGKVPISTAEVVIFFPVGVAGGLTILVAQLHALFRLRRAISQQVQSLENPLDVTLIAPLLIDPKMSIFEQMAGTLTLFFPFIVVLYSIRLILIRLEILKNKLPYFQSLRFYYVIYTISIILMVYSLIKIGFSFFHSRLLEKNHQ